MNFLCLATAYVFWVILYFCRLQCTKWQNQQWEERESHCMHLTLQLGTRTLVAGYKIGQFSFRCDIPITGTETLKDCSETCLEKLLWLLITNAKGKFLFFETIFFQNRTNQGLIPILQTHIFAGLLLKIMTSEKYCNILKIVFSTSLFCLYWNLEKHTWFVCLFLINY